MILISWQICLPDGCFFVPQQTCQDGGCVNEDVTKHIAERSDIFSSIISRPQLLLSAFLFVVFLFLSHRHLLSAQLESVFEIRIKNFSSTHNSFKILFSKGILHPKIY